MSLLRLNTRPSARDLRVFAALWLVFCFGLGVLFWRKGASRVALALFAAGAVGGAAGLVFPPAMRYVYLAGIYLSAPIGFVVSYLLLGVVYYLVLTPIGFIMRLLGHDPLDRRFEPQKKTYWKSRSEPKPAPSYFRQH